MPPELTPQILSPQVRGENPREVTDAFARIAGFFDDPISHITFTVGAEVADVRRFTGQVRDRLGRAFPGRWLVCLYTRDPAVGTPEAGDTITAIAPAIDLGDWWNAGSAGVHLVRSEDSGQLIVDVHVAGAASRQMVAAVLGRVLDGDTYTWAV